MVDDFGAEFMKRLFELGIVPYVALNKFSFRRDVVLRSRREVVDHEDFVTLGNIRFAYPGAYESRSACDYYFHFLSLRMP